jgi:asparagine synthase (glutamine-hydrolysing)
MPGLLGCVDWTSPIAASSFQRAFNTMARSGLSAESLVDHAGHWAIGRTHLDTFNPEPQLADGRHLHVLFCGELDPPRETTSRHVSNGEVVAGLYSSKGIAAVRTLRGAFSAAILDTTERSLVLLSDRLGSYPLYWFQSGSRFLFASELGALLRLQQNRATLDRRAVADYLTFGFLTGTRTLAADVTLVEPGCALRWTSAGAVRFERSAPMIELFERRERSREAYTSAVVEAFGASVQRATQPPGPLGMSLSGGLDSRTILSALGPARRSTHTYTLGVPGCADEVIALRLSGLGGTQHEFFPLDDRYLSDFLDHLRKMVTLTDGMYLSHGLTEMLAFGFLEQAPYRVLLRGHCGELAKTSLAWPLHTDKDVYDLQTAPQLIDHLLKRFRELSGNLAWQDAFADQWREEVAGGAKASLQESLHDVPLSPPEMCAYLYLREHHRRFTVPSLELFRNAVEIRLPFADEEFLTALLGGRPEWRDATELHRAIIQQFDPRLLAVRDSNTGARVDASPIAGFFGDKLNAVFKRLNVRGYRHYHSFDRWMERMLIQAVEADLMAVRSLDRGVLKREGLRVLVEGAQTGKRGYAYILQVLLILELWQQENLD